jgi:hypothetical protein
MTASDLSVAKNGRKGKNWKVYLFEFILLFLAVTLGFLADNFRESLSQQARAKTLLEALKTDLKADTLELTANIRFYQNSVVALDSLYEMLLMPPQDVDRSAYYRQLQKSILLVIFTPSKNASE